MLGGLASLKGYNPRTGSTKSRQSVINIAISVISFLLMVYMMKANWTLFLYRNMPVTDVVKSEINKECLPAFNPNYKGLDPDAVAPDYCTLPTDQTFKKFIWFVTDGFPRSAGHHIIHTFKEHAQTFVVEVPGIKYSHVIYTSWMTGQLPNNYKAAPIATDNIVSSMARSGNFRIKYIGPRWCFLAIVGDDVQAEAIEEVQEVKEPQSLKFDHAYPSLFMDDRDLQTNLTYLAERDMSVIAHSGVYDHVNHIQSGWWKHASKAGHYSLKEMGDIVAHDFDRLKNFIDTHPDYLLILSSDHGVDQDDIVHGHSGRGNDGFFTLYNPRLAPQKDVTVDVIDIAPTISKYLTGVDIPALSFGVARNYYGPGGNKSYAHALKQNVLQLSKLSKARGVTIAEDTLKAFLSLPTDTPADADKAVAQLLKVLNFIKAEMYRIMMPNWTSIAWYITVLIVLTLLNIYEYSNGLFWLITRKYFRPAIFYFVVIALIYWCCYSHFMFGWWKWKNTFFAKGVLWKLSSPLLAGLLCYFASRLPFVQSTKSNSRSPDDGESGDDAPTKTVLTDTSSNTLVTYVHHIYHYGVTDSRYLAFRNLVVFNELANYVFRAVPSHFKKDHYFEGLYDNDIAAFLVYVVAAYFIFFYYSRRKTPSLARLLSTGSSTGLGPGVAVQEGVSTKRMYKLKINNLSPSVPTGPKKKPTRSRLTVKDFVGALVVLPRDFWAAEAVLAVIGLFQLSEQTEDMFFSIDSMVYGFHKIGIFAYLGILSLTVYYVCTAGRRILDVIVPINLLVFMVWKDSVLFRLILLLFNFQMVFSYLRILDYAATVAYTSHKQARSRMKASSQPRDWLVCVYHMLDSSILYQAAVVYAYMYMFYAFRFFLGDKINISVNPNAGRVALWMDNIYTTFSAMLMILHKYAPVIIGTVYIWVQTQIWRWPGTPPAGASSTPIPLTSSEGGRPALVDTSGLPPFSRFFAMYNVLSLPALSGGFMTALWYYTRYHGPQECFALLLTTGILGLCHFIFTFVSYFPVIRRALFRIVVIKVFPQLKDRLMNKAGPTVGHFD